MSANRTFECRYCGKEIEPDDRAALRITVTGLWSSAHEAAQDLFAHSKCAADKFAGNLSQWVPFNVETFTSD
jgi:transposase